MNEGTRLLAWARRWLRAEDVTRVIGPAVADWRYEVEHADERSRRQVSRRGRRAVLAAIARVMLNERLALARATPWWILSFPLLAVATGIMFAATGLAQAAFFGVGVAVFALVATTPSRWIGSAWSWLGVGSLAITLLVGEAHAGATRWVALGPLHIQMTMLVLPLLVVGGWRPAAVAAGLLAFAPDALASSALAVAVPHPLTIAATVVAWIREPAMGVDAVMPWPMLLSAALVVVAAWRYRGCPEARALMVVMLLGAGLHVAGHAPMPLVGYGGSAIVATCLALALAASRASQSRVASSTFM